MLELQRAGGFGLAALLLHSRNFRFVLDLHTRQHRDDLVFEARQHVVEHRERFALVFLLRVFLRVGTQIDALAQVVHRCQMLTPEAIQSLQGDGFLEVFEDRRTDLLALGGVSVDDRLQDACAQSALVECLVLVQPLAQRQRQREITLQRFFQAFDVPQLVDALRRDEGVNDGIDDPAADLVDHRRDPLGRHQLVAQLVDHLALVVGDVVVFEQMLADVEVVRLDLALRGFDGVGHPAVFQHLAFLHAELLQHRAHARRQEDAHQIVFERQIEARSTGVALTAGTAAQLVVDAPRLVAFGADDIQAAGGDRLIVPDLPFGARRGASGCVVLGDAGQLGFQTAAQHDVGAAAGHIGGNRHSAGTSGLGDDLRLTLVLLGVQHLVLDVLVAQNARQQLGGFNRRGADQRRLAAFARTEDLLDDGVVLLLGGHEHLIAAVVANHRPVGRHDDHFQAVDALELVGLGIRRTGHARQLFVHAEVVLERDRRQRLVFLLDRHVLLGLNRLMQAVAPAPARHHAAGELVDDDDLAVANDVFDVALVQMMSAQQGVQVVHQHDAAGVVEAFLFAEQAGVAQQLLDALVAFFRQMDLLALVVQEEVAGAFFLRLRREPGNDDVDALPQLRIVVGRAADDQRRARLVDQDRVDLVDDRVELAALDFLRHRERHVVAQVVEAQLVVGRVGDVGRISLALLRRRLARHDDADAQAEKAVDAPHPLGVAARQIVIDGDDVHALARQGVQIGRQRGDQGLAFASAHLGDLAFVHHRAADQLDVEMAHAEHALAGLTDDREGFGLQRVECFALGEPFAEQCGLRRELRVAHVRELGFQSANPGGEPTQTFDDTLIPAAENAGKQLVGHDDKAEKSKARRAQAPGRRNGRVLYYALSLGRTARCSRTGRLRGRTRDQRAAWMNCSGLTTLPFNNTSKCTCGPVDRPVLPIFAIGSPRCTR